MKKKSYNVISAENININIFDKVQSNLNKISCGKDVVYMEAEHFTAEH